MTEVSSTRVRGCHLCEEALEAIVALHAEGYRFELREVDIESDELLLRATWSESPWSRSTASVVSELSLDEAGLRARLDTVGAWRRRSRSVRWPKG